MKHIMLCLPTAVKEYFIKILKESPYHDYLYHFKFSWRKTKGWPKDQYWDLMVKFDKTIKKDMITEAHAFVHGYFVCLHDEFMRRDNA